LAELDSTTAAESPKPRRRTVLASALLCGVFGIVVMYTNRRAFFSPLAVVVVAAIGLVAVLLQLRFHNRASEHTVHPPLWLNLLGIVFAVGALFADLMRLSSQAAEALALGAVGCFGISSAIILHAFRKHRIAAKS
jgi:drug/metabolite transporter (DMT)-like permease